MNVNTECTSSYYLVLDVYMVPVTQQNRMMWLAFLLLVTSAFHERMITNIQFNSIPNSYLIMLYENSTNSTKEKTTKQSSMTFTRQRTY